MPRVAFLTRAIDEAGNAIGGSGTEVRVFDDFGATSASVVTADVAGAITIAQPITANAGTQTTLATTTVVGDTTLVVASVTGFAVGQLIPIYDGTTTKYRFITAINAGTKTLTIETAIGTAFSNTNTSVGNPDMQGVVAGWVDDASYHYIQTKDVASTRVMPPTLIPTKIGSSSVNVQEEGSTIATRPTLNFIGSSVTAVDNAGSARSDITFTGLMADGTVGAPSHGFVSDTDTGFYRIGANDFAATAFGKAVLEFLSGGAGTEADWLRVTNGTGHAYLAAAGGSANVNTHVSAKGTADMLLELGAVARFVYLGIPAAGNYLYAKNAATGSGATLGVEGTADANIDILLVPKGTGLVKYLGAEIGVKPTTASANLSADAAMPSSNTFVDGPSVSLTAGTWLLVGTVTVHDNSTGGKYTAKLWDGTTAYASTEIVGGASAPELPLPLSAIVSPGSTTTYKISVATTLGNAGCLIKAATTDNGAGNNASHLRAVRLYL